MIFFDIIAWMATILGVGMYIPQVIKTVKTRNTKELSKITFTTIAFGTGFWTIYTATINNPSYQGWVMNIIILFLMLPILYLLYSKKLFVLISCLLLGLLLTSVFFLVFSVSFKNAIKYLFVIFASLGTSVPFYFQVYKTFKDKNASSLSFLTLIIILVTNVLWSTYWLGKLILENNPTAIIAFIAGAITSISQLPLIYASLKFKK